MKRPTLLLSLLPATMSCESTPRPRHLAAAHVTQAVAESTLPTVHLSPRAKARLRIETTTVTRGTIPHTRLVGGEVVVPPGRTAVVAAPVAGKVQFIARDSLAPGTLVDEGAELLRLVAIAPTDRDTQARVTREVSAAQANLAALQLRVSRNQTLIAQGAGSERALEEATAERNVARADVAAAKSRAAMLSRAPLLSDVAMMIRAPSNGVVRMLSVAEGQAVAAGAALFEVVDVDALQVRVPVYSGDLSRLADKSPAQVRRSGETTPIEAVFAVGPPTANPERITVDRYLRLPSDAPFALGERVLVELPLKQQAEGWLVPTSSVVLDAWGGAWVYTCQGEQFTRARVDPARRAGDRLLLAHGPSEGTCVVSVGAVELFGAEFPPGH